MNNKLSYNDKTVKIDSFTSLFDYAFSKISTYTKDEFFLDVLVNNYFNNIEEGKKSDPLQLSNEFNSAYNSIDKSYLKNPNKLLIITFLMSKCNEHLSELFLSKLR